jgi:CRISPR-associated protein Cas2
MLTWILYDIEVTRARTKVSKLCQKAGLYRVQLSCFLGDINQTEIKELSTHIEDLINPEKDKVYIFPISKDDFEKTILLGIAFDKDLVTDEIKALFL